MKPTTVATTRRAVAPPSTPATPAAWPIGSTSPSTRSISRTSSTAIIDYFADEYLAGRTPNPCVVCNTWLKFGQLWDFGQQLDADFIATGHYARICHGSDGGRSCIAPPIPDKDQSYVLYGIRREMLRHLLFPVGGYRKEEVRSLARQAGLAEWPASPTASRSASSPTAITPS